jgi:hypothetical protein
MARQHQRKYGIIQGKGEEGPGTFRQNCGKALKEKERNDLAQFDRNAESLKEQAKNDLAYVKGNEESLGELQWLTYFCGEWQGRPRSRRLLCKGNACK